MSDLKLVVPISKSKGLIKTKIKGKIDSIILHTEGKILLNIE
jgi:hypothetical protein